MRYIVAGWADQTAYENESPLHFASVLDAKNAGYACTKAKTEQKYGTYFKAYTEQEYIEKFGAITRQRKVMNRQRKSNINT